jgi:hypothetical protein
MYQFASSTTMNNSNEEEGIEERPSHPSPDIQMKRKLEMTLLERNQWQLRAT